MRSDIFKFLYGDSQEESAQDEALDHIQAILEAADDESPIEVKKAPLATALKSFGIEAEDGLQMDPEGFCMHFVNDQDYHKVSTILFQPEVMEKLAEMGWVAHRLGDSAMANEEPEYRVRFIEIATAETTSADEPSQTIKDILKAGREFATTPMDRDSETNPVETEEFTGDEAGEAKQPDRNKGMSKATDGKEAEHAIHGGKSKSESRHR